MNNKKKVSKKIRERISDSGTRDDDDDGANRTSEEPIVKNKNEIKLKQSPDIKTKSRR